MARRPPVFSPAPILSAGAICLGPGRQSWAELAAVTHRSSWVRSRENLAGPRQAVKGFTSSHVLPACSTSSNGCSASSARTTPPGGWAAMKFLACSRKFSRAGRGVRVCCFFKVRCGTPWMRAILRRRRATVEFMECDQDDGVTDGQDHPRPTWPGGGRGIHDSNAAFHWVCPMPRGPRTWAGAGAFVSP